MVSGYLSDSNYSVNGGGRGDVTDSEPWRVYELDLASDWDRGSF